MINTEWRHYEAADACSTTENLIPKSLHRGTSIGVGWSERVQEFCLALTWDLVDFIEELVLDLVEGIVLVDWFGGVVIIGDWCDRGRSHSQGTGPCWLGSDHGRCLMPEQVKLRHLGCTHSPWKTAWKQYLRQVQVFSKQSNLFLLCIVEGRCCEVTHYRFVSFVQFNGLWGHLKKENSNLMFNAWNHWKTMKRRNDSLNSQAYKTLLGSSGIKDKVVWS